MSAIKIIIIALLAIFAVCAVAGSIVKSKKMQPGEDRLASVACAYMASGAIGLIIYLVGDAMTHAKGTKVSIGTSEEQIKTALRKAGAETVGIMEEPGFAYVAFHLHGRSIRFKLPLPRRSEFETSPSGRQARSLETIDRAWMQASRERYRQLLLCIKAKLVSVEEQIESFDDAFLSQIVTPDGQTMGEKIKPQMAAVMDGRPLRPLIEHH